MYPKHANITLKTNTNDVVSDLFFSSYIFAYSKYGNKNNYCGLTTFNKIITNFVEDWYEHIKCDYKPIMDIEGNPYGMVTTIPYTLYDSPNLEISHLYIYELCTLARKNSLWEKKLIDEDKKKIETIMKPTELREILTTNSEKRFSMEFDDKIVSDGETLSIIYSELLPRELNFLCSFRDIKKSEECLNFAFKCWSTEFNNTINSLRNPLTSERDQSKRLTRSVYRFARSCEQLDLKIYYILNEMPKLIKKFDDELVPKYQNDRSIRPVLNDIVKDLHKFAPIYNDKYILELREKNRLNIQRIYPLSKALIRFYFNESGYSSDLATFEDYRKMMNSIRLMDGALKDKAVCDINPNLEFINNIYKKFYREQYELLKRFPSNGRKRKRVDWTSGDRGDE